MLRPHDRRGANGLGFPVGDWRDDDLRFAGRRGFAAGKTAVQPGYPTHSLGQMFSLSWAGSKHAQSEIAARCARSRARKGGVQAGEAGRVGIGEANLHHGPRRPHASGGIAPAFDRVRESKTETMDRRGVRISTALGLHHSRATGGSQGDPEMDEWLQIDNELMQGVSAAANQMRYE